MISNVVWECKKCGIRDVIRQVDLSYQTGLIWGRVEENHRRLKGSCLNTNFEIKITPHIKIKDFAAVLRRIKEVCQSYTIKYATEFQSKAWPKDVCLGLDHADAHAHILQMLPQMDRFLAEGRTDKLIRWLCWIQGVLFAQGLLTIQESMEMNRAILAAD